MILTIRVEESVGSALKAMAEADDRRLSNYIARLLRRHVEAQDGKAGETKARGRKS